MNWTRADEMGAFVEALRIVPERVKVCPAGGGTVGGTVGVGPEGLLPPHAAASKTL
jgi:hypothetical protein